MEGQGPEADIPNFRLSVTVVDGEAEEDPRGLTWEVEAVDTYTIPPAMEPHVHSLLSGVMNAWASLGHRRGFTEELLERCALEMRQTFIRLVAHGVIQSSRKQPFVVRQAEKRDDRKPDMKAAHSRNRRNVTR